MTYQQVYKAQHARVVRERVLKSAIFGGLAGLGVAAVIAFVTIFVSFNGLWTAIGAGLGVAAITTLVLYFAMFRPTEKSVAQSIDKQGFDERAITMLELKDESSVMAEMQRNNAVEVITAAAENNGGKLQSGKAVPVSQKLRELGLSKKMLIISGVIVVIAIISLVLTALPTERVKEIFLGTNSYGVSYNAGEHGYIVSESGGYRYNSELARKGKFTAQVDEGKYSERIVVSAYDDPEDSYMFAGWSDDYYDEFNGASRSDKVNMGINATARYEHIESVEDDLGEDDIPAFGSVPPSPNGKPQPGDNGFGGGAGAGSAELNGEVVDGQTEYHEYYDDWYQEAMNRLAEGKDLPESLRKMLAAYFEALK